MIDICDFIYNQERLIGWNNGVTKKEIFDQNKFLNQLLEFENSVLLTLNLPLLLHFKQVTIPLR